MKTRLLLLQVIIWMSSPAFSQNLQGIDSSETISLLNKGSSMAIHLALLETDTCYYEDGKIASIAFYPKPIYKLESLVFSKYVLRSRVLEYDKCGNLRNRKETSYFEGVINSCWDPQFNNREKVVNTLIENVDCDEPWAAPILFKTTKNSPKSTE